MKSPMIPTFVYAVRCGEWIKIGVAKNIASRMGGMRVNCPYPLVLVGSRQFPSADEAYRVEDAAHLALARQRHFGEWFLDAPLSPVALLVELYERRGLEPVSGDIDPRKPFSVFPDYEMPKQTYSDIYGPT